MEEKLTKDIISLNDQELRQVILTHHPYDVAEVFKELNEEERKRIFNVLDPKEAADIMEYLDSEDSAAYLEDMSLEQSSNIISEMELDDAVDVLNELDEDVKKEVIENIDSDILEDIIDLSSYGENEAGSIMTDNYLALDVNMKVSQAMSKLVKESNEQETIDVLFVLDEEKLVGIIDLKDLIIARKNEDIKDIMNTNFKYVDAHSEVVVAAELINEYALLALPVLDNGILKGIITVDDAMDLINEEITEDYGKMAGITGDDEDNYKIFKVIKSRLVWLVVLLFLSFLVSSVMKGFDSVIASVTCLVFFQSLILDMGGNAGTQALATTIVDLSKDELSTKHLIKKHLGKEFLVGLINSVCLGLMAFLTALAFIYIGNVTSTYQPLQLALVIGVAMMIALIVSNFIGALVPIILFKLHIDPAVASGPFISTLNDIISVSIYYGLAYLILLVGGGF